MGVSQTRSSPSISYQSVFKALPIRFTPVIEYQALQAFAHQVLGYYMPGVDKEGNEQPKVIRPSANQLEESQIEEWLLSLDFEYVILNILNLSYF